MDKKLRVSKPQLQTIKGQQLKQELTILNPKERAQLVWKILQTKVFDFKEFQAVDQEEKLHVALITYLVLVNARPASLLEATNLGNEILIFYKIIENLDMYFRNLQIKIYKGSQPRALLYTSSSINPKKANEDGNYLGELLDFVCPGEFGTGVPYGINIDLYDDGESERIMTLTSEKCKRFDNKELEKKTEIMNRYEKAIQYIMPTSTLRLDVEFSLSPVELLAEIIKSDKKEFDRLVPSLENVLLNNGFVKTAKYVKRGSAVVNFTILKIILTFIINNPIEQFYPLDPSQDEQYNTDIQQWETMLYKTFRD